MNSYFRRARFTKSAASLSQLPGCSDHLEVAFAGRSNSGKSSAINALCNQKSLARTSKTPGRTQLINIFSLDERRSLIDLPGYGFAKVNSSIREQWRGLLSDYIEQRSCLRGVVVMMDCRHPLKPLDMQMLQWCTHLDLPVHVLLTKADKLNKGPAKSTLLQVRQALKKYDNISVQLFSSLKKSGIDEAQLLLEQWLELEDV